LPLSESRKFILTVRAVFAAWIVILVAVSIFPVSFKLKLHTSGVFHDVGHYLVFAFTAMFLWMITEGPLARVLGFVGGAVFSFSQEWAENRLYHAGFEWKDVGNDLAGLVSGFALMVLLTSLWASSNSVRR